MAHTRVLIVEDELIVAQKLRFQLDTLGYEVLGIVMSGEEALHVVAHTPPDIVLMDIELQGELDGVQTAEQIHTRFDIPVIYITAYADPATVQRARTTAPSGYILKPFDMRELQVALEIALYKHAVDRRIRANERWLTTVLRSIGEAVITTSTEQRVTFLNPVAEHLTGWSQAEALGQDITAIVRFVDTVTGEPIAHPVPHVLHLGTTVQLQNHISLVRRDGTTLEVDNSTAPIQDDRNLLLGAVMVLRDISERRAFERKLLETQKLESLGVLAGGIAHDFNNMLAVILGNASLALLDAPEGSALYKAIEPIVSTARRAAELTGQMLTYAGRGQVEVQPLNLNTLVQEMTTLLQASLTHKARLHYTLAPQLPLILADATRIRQLLLNLVINASEAIHDPGGIVSVTTGMRSVDRAYLAGSSFASDVPEGNYVYLEVQDTGCGMDAETLARIFDPFFTTKFTGRGMGLPAVLGIVRRHQGAIKVESRVGVGTTCTVIFPPADAPFLRQQAEIADTTAAPAAAPPTATSVIAAAAHTVIGSILVIDDEVEVGNLIARVLEYHGHTVLTATSSQTGLAALQSHLADIDCVLLDLSMPGMSGEQVLRALRAMSRDIPVILMSGYSEEQVIGRFVGAHLSGFLQKPFTTSALLAMIQRVLANPRP